MKGFKIVMLFAIWLCSLSGVLPKVIPQLNSNPTFLSLLNCFSAGIFLGMALIHVIPEGIEIYEEWAEEKKIERPFPLAFVLIFVGYLMVLSIDRVLASWLLKLTGKEHEAHLGHSHGGNEHDHDQDHDDHEHRHGAGHMPTKHKNENEGFFHAHVDILAEVDEIPDQCPNKAEPKERLK